jgi:hypothetical protein
MRAGPSNETTRNLQHRLHKLCRRDVNKQYFPYIDYDEIHEAIQACQIAIRKASTRPRSVPGIDILHQYRQLCTDWTDVLTAPLTRR